MRRAVGHNFLRFKWALALLLLFCFHVNQLVQSAEGSRDHGSEISNYSESSKDGFFGSFISSFSMTTLSELGDKTFLIAGIMAMRYDRFTIFSGAIAALGIMTIVSALLGSFVSTFLPKIYTFYISILLFVLFGMRMLYEGANMREDQELKEMNDLQIDLRQREVKENGSAACGQNNRRRFVDILPPVFIQAFSMTFLAEWGDRSQITFIMLAAREDVFGICVGGVAGHALCTGLAVLGGKMIAQRISVKSVTLVGGLVFLGFGIMPFFGAIFK